MATSSTCATVAVRRLCAAALVILSTTASAAPGFVSSSHVETGSLYSEITIHFRCKVHYLGHDPSDKTDVLRVRLEATTVCTGASPDIANSRELHRPLNADVASLDSIEYDGETPGNQLLRFNFTADVTLKVSARPGGDALSVQVFKAGSAPDSRPAIAAAPTRMNRQPAAPAPRYVINLESSRRAPATADLPALDPGDGRRVFVTEALIGGQTWYRTRVGYFATAAEASRELRQLRSRFPRAWVDAATEAPNLIEPAATVTEAAAAVDVNNAEPARASASAGGEDKVSLLMHDARRAMTAGEISRAVQIYTKVLQMPPHDSQREAQEYLALARERNGQVAHARAEYQRYLDLYPDGEGADRVRQRLSALLAGTSKQDKAPVASADTAAQRKSPSAWKMRTFLSQRYRRDVNQVNDEDEVVNQSSIYTDLSLDARRRGERFDFASRITAGHRTNLLSDDDGSSGNDVRLSYAYADLSDSQTGLRGRIGRQTRTGGGVLGRFDGLNLAYAVTERLRLDAVYGKPVFSTGDGIDELRTFQGLSATFGPVGENLDLGLFYLQQDIDGLTDRQSVGGEVRYFGENRTLWGMFDYDVAFKELASGFLQGTIRLPANFTVTGLFDKRRSPYLGLGNALVGQIDQDFADLTASLAEDEIRQLALDRSAATTTVTLGLSRPLSPKLQLGLNATRSDVDATVESGGVAAVPASTYSYFSVDLVASSLFTQGDVGIISLRHAETSTTDIETLNVDARFPLGRAWRINPRLRVDFRRIRSDMSEERIYTPGLRLQYRPSRRLRVELEAGKQFSTRAMATADLDRESYFVNLGYQFFY